MRPISVRRLQPLTYWYFSWIECRLYAHNPLTFHFAVLAITVKNLPVAAVQFYREIILVLYGYTVSKHKLRLQGIGIVWLVEGFYTYFYAFRHFRDHRNFVCTGKVQKKRLSG